MKYSALSGDQMQYTGQIQDGQMHGKGTLVYPNSERYEVAAAKHPPLCVWSRSQVELRGCHPCVEPLCRPLPPWPVLLSAGRLGVWQAPWLRKLLLLGRWKVRGRGECSAELPSTLETGSFLRTVNGVERIPVGAHSPTHRAGCLRGLLVAHYDCSSRRCYSFCDDNVLLCSGWTTRSTARVNRGTPMATCTRARCVCAAMGALCFSRGVAVLLATAVVQSLYDFLPFGGLPSGCPSVSSGTTVASAALARSSTRTVTGASRALLPRRRAVQLLHTSTLYASSVSSITGRRYQPAGGRGTMSGVTGSPTLGLCPPPIPLCQVRRPLARRQDARSGHVWLRRWRQVRGRMEGRQAPRQGYGDVPRTGRKHRGEVRGASRVTSYTRRPVAPP